MNETLAGHMLDGRYRVDALIGRGGMADVCRGYDAVLDRAVAIKVLTGRGEGERDRFLREAQSMARLNHHNIVAVYDAGRSPDWSYIVMELVDGKTLASHAAHEMPLDTAIRCYIDILDALAYAHENDVIHRDIKPANVMVLPDGAVKVMDFGLARRASDLSTSTTAGEIAGTVAYLPPERFLGKPSDARGDLYSVGVMLFETLTGSLPFTSDTDDLVAVIFRHINDPAPAPRSINPGVPVEIETVILTLLEKEPERRYQSAHAVAAALRSLLGDASPFPVEPAIPPRPPRPAPPFVERRAAPNPIEMLARTFGRTGNVDRGSRETLAGMLATRKRDYPEATRAYRAALGAFARTNDALETAKTSLEFATMIMQKNTEAEDQGGCMDPRELSEAVDVLTDALPSFRGRSMFKELEEGERLLSTLQRTLIRTR